ncbi:MAG TPA: histidinol dehydrogenase [Solirubrobacterales bacterium]|nr:histidinol dehydrogenase [Solirubrobacterales bacterium]
MRLERLTWDGADAEALAARLRRVAEPPTYLAERVAEIIERVRSQGDAALMEMSVAFDGAERLPDSLRVPADEIEAAFDTLDTDLAAALRLAEANIRAVAEAELRPPTEIGLIQGHQVSVVQRPVASAGVYAPGGRAAYPSSVLMGLVPARVAGVSRVALVSPPGPDGRPPRAVLAAARIGEADEVYAIGGAQAVAALAIGTASVDRVDVIAGPGNAWVTEAKRQLFGTVGIDGLAGPSELVVVADATSGPRKIALDALAQAEHGPDSPIVVASADSALLVETADALKSLAPDRPSVADAPITLIEAPSLDHALHLADAFAPEHLELHFEGAAERAPARIAGCVFVGEAGAAAFGDYTAGSNHVLPTGGAARFSGPLGVGAFTRRMSVVDVPRSAAAKLYEATDEIARSEGLPVHGESAIAQIQTNK